MLAPETFVVCISSLLSTASITVDASCTLGSQVDPTSPYTTGGQYIDLEHPVECSGNITVWHFCYYSELIIAQLVVEFRVWRPTSEISFDRVYQYRVNYVQLQQNDSIVLMCQDITLQETEYFEVQQNDSLGVYIFTVGSPIYIISQNTVGFGLYYDTRNGLTPFSSFNVASTDLQLNSTLGLHLYADIASLLPSSIQPASMPSSTAEPQQPIPPTILSTYLSTPLPTVVTTIISSLLPSSIQPASMPPSTAEPQQPIPSTILSTYLSTPLPTVVTTIISSLLPSSIQPASMPSSTAEPQQPIPSTILSTYLSTPLPTVVTTIISSPLPSSIQPSSMAPQPIPPTILSSYSSTPLPTVVTTITSSLLSSSIQPAFMASSTAESQQPIPPTILSSYSSTPLPTVVTTITLSGGTQPTSSSFSTLLPHLETPESISNEQDSPPLVIIGGAVGALVAVAVIVVVLTTLACITRKKRTAPHVANGETDMEENDAYGKHSGVIVTDQNEAYGTQGVRALHQNEAYGTQGVVALHQNEAYGTQGVFLSPYEAYGTTSDGDYDYVRI